MSLHIGKAETEGHKPGLSCYRFSATESQPDRGKSLVLYIFSTRFQFSGESPGWYFDLRMREFRCGPNLLAHSSCPQGRGNTLILFAAQSNHSSLAPSFV